MVAQVAAEEPDTVPKIAQPSTLTCISLPGSQPSHGDRPSNISSDRRVRYRISPIQTNSGSAASVHEALEPQNDWNRFTSGGVLVKNCSPNQATAASAIAIHTPPISSTSSRAKRMSPAASGVIGLTPCEGGREPKANGGFDFPQKTNPPLAKSARFPP